MESELINRAKDNKIMGAVSIIDIEVYQQKIILFYGKTVEFEDYMQEQLNISVEVKSGTTAKTLDLKTRAGRKLILFINESYIESFSEQYYISVTHEVYHLVAYILSFAGVVYDMDNDEPGAHLTGYINKELFRLFEKTFED